MIACAGIDTGDPDRAELSFLLLSVAVGVDETFFNSVFRYGPYIFFASEETFGKFQEALALSPGGYVID